jgi:hypothetical protein
VPRKQVLWLVGVFAMAAGLVAAQQDMPALVGTITQVGTPSPGVTVTVTNVQTGQAFITRTDADGRYMFASLPLGKYDLRADSGMSSGPVNVTGIVLDTGGNAPVDVELARIAGKGGPPVLSPRLTGRAFLTSNERLG